MWRSGWKRRSVAGLVRYGVLDMSWATDKQGVLPASPGSLAWSKILTVVGNHWKVLSRGMSDQICISKGLSDCRWRTKCGRAEEVREYRGPGGGRGCANTLVILRLPCLPLGIVLRAFSLLAPALPGCAQILKSDLPLYFPIEALFYLLSTSAHLALNLSNPAFPLDYHFLEGWAQSHLSLCFL